MDRQDIITGKVKPVFITEKGVKLYLDDDMVKIFNNRIKQLKLTNVQTFLAVHPEGDTEYLLVKDSEPYFASSRADDIEGKIEILGIIRKYGNERYAQMKMEKKK